MQEMMKSLNFMEDLIGGNDLDQIRKMMGISKHTINQHMD